MSAMVVTVRWLRWGKVSWQGDGNPVEACSLHPLSCGPKFSKVYIREVLTHTEYDDEKWKR